MKYNPEIDYCGPGRGWLTKLIPNEIGGVSVNYYCYKHDVGYATSDRRKVQDKAFRNDIKEAYKDAGKPVLGFFVSWTYYIAVRIGGAFVHGAKKKDD